jgi:hypothetical protein
MGKGNIAVGAGTGVLVAGSIGAAVGAVGAQPASTRLALIVQHKIIFVVANVVLLIRVFIALSFLIS